MRSSRFDCLEPELSAALGAWFWSRGVSPPASIEASGLVDPSIDASGPGTPVSSRSACTYCAGAGSLLIMGEASGESIFAYEALLQSSSATIAQTALYNQILEALRSQPPPAPASS